MALQIKKAVRSQSWLRMALVGPSGSGKTFTGLAVLSDLAKLEGGGKILCIDSENGSASKYARGGRGGFGFDFDVLELADEFSLETYIESIEMAAREGYTRLLIDSLTHCWAGTGGALEAVDRKAALSKSGNTFTAWKDITPLHNKLIHTMTRFPGHLVATIRSKMSYVLEEDDKGKKVPRRVGMQPVQRDGMEYEFDLVGEMDLDNTLRVVKSRCADLVGAIQNRPGVKLAKTLHEWLSDGDPLAPAAAPKAAPATTTATNGNGSHNGSMADPTLAGLTRDQLLARLPDRVGAFFMSLGKQAPSALGDDALRAAVSWIERPAGQNVYKGWLRLQEPATTTATESVTESPPPPPGPAPGVSPTGDGGGIPDGAPRPSQATETDLRRLRAAIRRMEFAVTEVEFTRICAAAGTTLEDWTDAGVGQLEHIAAALEEADAAQKAG